MKKLVSMFLSLLLCVSMLASLPQAVCSAEEPEPNPVVDVDPVGPEGPINPEEPEEPLRPMDDAPELNGDGF